MPDAAAATSTALATAFVSYSRTDMEFCDRVRQSLQQIGCEAWYDNKVRKGTQWWDDILDHIEDSDVFVRLLSPMSIESPSCISEYDYAQQLGKPIVRVQVRPLDKTDLSGLSEEEQTDNWVNLLEDSTESGIGLGDAYSTKLNESRETESSEPGESPSSELSRPPAPITDLTPILEQIRVADLDNKADEDALVARLMALEHEIDHLDAVLEAVNKMRARPRLMDESISALDALAARLGRKVRADDLRLSRNTWRTRTPADLRKADPGLTQRTAPLAGRISNKKFVPMLGWGTAEYLLGPLHFLIADWAVRHGWPGGQQARDLPAAAQYLQVTTDREVLISELVRSLGRQLTEWKRLDSPPDASDGASFDALLTDVWREDRKERRAEGRPDDPFTMLAGLDCTVYVVAHPWSLMTEALRAHGKDPVVAGGQPPVEPVSEKKPVVDVCWWDLDHATRPPTPEVPIPPGWPEPSPVYATPQGAAPYEPSVDRPLVFHVFGHIAHEGSLVLTEADHLDFLINSFKQLDIIPPVVRGHVALSAVLMLGFELEETAVQVLMRSLVDQADPGVRGARSPNVGTQDVNSLDTNDPLYLNYVSEQFRAGRPELGVVWGRADEFTPLLSEEIERYR